ncbi:MAG TPA: ABC transporter permease [Candidatus Binatia bacterium]|nr:ABC transporter permease [Candidatus Binatia bacterium]
MRVPLAYNLRNLLVRRWTTAFTMGGVALVVAATMLLAALVGGLQGMLVATGEPDNLIVLRKGSTSDGSSVVPREATRMLRMLAGVARDADGRPLASTELVNQPFVRIDGGRENVLMRGVEPVAFRVHRSVRLVEGRMFRPQLSEVVIGRGVQRRYAPDGLGSRIDVGRRRWTVVGVFDSGGTAFDSEIWGDVRDIEDDARRSGFFSAVRLRVEPGSDPAALMHRIADDPRWALEAKPETVFYREQAETANSLYVLVITLGVVMATGAVFGALNTMYAAVAGRTAEIGTLRALGFARGAILVSFLTESLLLAAGGLVAGAALAALAVIAINTLLSGVQFSMMTFTVATVLLRVTPAGFLLALVFATAVGVFGGLAPAWRAAHLRVVDALHRA